MPKKLACLIVVIVLMVLGVPAQSAETTLQQEAARFAKEAEFLRSHGRYEASLEKAETARALDFDNEAILQNLAIALVMYANNITKIIDSYPQEMPSSLQEVRQALAYAVRVQDIIETLPPNMRYSGALSGNGTYNMPNLRKCLLKYATEKYPELRNEVDQFNKRHLDFWMANSYRPRVAAEISKDAVKTNDSVFFYNLVYSGCYNIFTSQADSNIVHCYEEMVNDWLAVGYRGDNRGTIDRILIKHIAFLSGRQKYLPLEAKDASIAAALERIAKKLEDDPRPMFRHNGWIVRHNHGWFISGPHNKKQDALNYFNRLREHIAGLPREEADIEVLYASLYEVIQYCYASSEQIQRFSLMLEIFRLADSREDTLNNIIAYALHGFLRETDLEISDSLRKVVPEHVKLLERHITDIRRDMPEYVTLLERQIERLERTNPERAAQYQANLTAKRWDTPPRSTPLPWTEEVLLAGAPRPFVRPVVRGNKVYFMKPSNQVEVSSIDLVTGEKTTSEPLPGESPAHGQMCVDDDNVYYGGSSYFEKSKHGLYVFPHDGSTPWAMGPEEGLPSGYVRALAPFHGKLYLGVGDPEQTTYFVRVDPKTRKIEILASSSGREGKAPFFNMSPPPQYQFFLEDTLRDRLLLHLHKREERAAAELWAMDGKTEQFTRLFRLTGCEQLPAGSFLPNGNQLVLFGSATYLVNLDGKEPQTPVFFTSGYRPDKPIIQGAYPVGGNGRVCIFKDWLWGTLYVADSNSTMAWGRIALDGKSKFELLPVPQALASSNILWLYCLPTADGKGLLVGDAENLVLLRFE